RDPLPGGVHADRHRRGLDAGQSLPARVPPGAPEGRAAPAGGACQGSLPRIAAVRRIGANRPAWSFVPTWMCHGGDLPCRKRSAAPSPSIPHGAFAEIGRSCMKTFKGSIVTASLVLAGLLAGPAVAQESFSKLVGEVKVGDVQKSDVQRLPFLT